MGMARGGSKRGRKLSTKTRAKMSAAAKERYRRERELELALRKAATRYSEVI
jgi:hypothetical protein